VKSTTTSGSSWWGGGGGVEQEARVDTCRRSGSGRRPVQQGRSAVLRPHSAHRTSVSVQQQAIPQHRKRSRSEARLYGALAAKSEGRRAACRAEASKTIGWGTTAAVKMVRICAPAVEEAGVR